MSTSNVLSLVYASQQVTIYLGIPILILGVIGNIFNLIVFLSLKTFRENSCAFYLMIMSAVSAGQLLVTFSSRIMIYGFNIDWTLSSLFYCKFRIYCGTICTLTILTCLCLATIDQFLATCSNPQWQRWSNIKVAHRATLVFVCIWLLHGIPYLIYYNQIISPTTGKVTCMNSNDMFIQYHSKFYTFVLIGYLPIFIDVIFALLAYRNVKHLAYRTVPVVRRALDNQLTIIVLMQTAFVFLAINPYLITSILSSDANFMRDSNNVERLRLASSVTTCIYNLNFASSFYAYICVSERFRQQFIHVVFRIYGDRCLQKIKTVNQVAPQS